MARELPSPENLLRPRDHSPIIYVPAYVWHCVVCDPMEPGETYAQWNERVAGRPTTVKWLGPFIEAPAGRCAECGQKYSLARPYEVAPVARAGATRAARLGLLAALQRARGWRRKR